MIGIVMGSTSDLAIMRHCAEMLENFEIPYEIRVLSAHRQLDATAEWARGAKGRGIKVLIAGAGLAAHLPGVISAATTLPVLGVPLPGSTIGALDSLYSIVQMPRGIPVGTLAIGKAGAVNAALLAAQIVALDNDELSARLGKFRETMRSDAAQKDEQLQTALSDRESAETVGQALQKAGFIKSL